MYQILNPKMKYCSIILIGLFISCNTTRINFKYFDRQPKKLTLNIPRKLKRQYFKVEEGRMSYYKAADSSILYITDIEEFSPNDLLILKQNKIGIRQILPDTTFEGVSQNRFWKEIKRGGLFLGYSNVLPSDKAIFDLSLNSVKFR